MTDAVAARQGVGAEEATVLIVDDERGPRESLRLILSASYRVLVCSGGAEALEILRRTPVELITLDLNMPGIRGEELMRTVRDEFPHIEVIVITGHQTVESATEALRFGICDYLTKPFDVVQVGAAAARALARQRSRFELVRFLDGLADMVGGDREAPAVLAALENDAPLQASIRALAAPILHPSSARAGLNATGTLEFLEVLAGTIESRDPCMRGHARQVAFYADFLAERLELADADREHVRIASFLHDVGTVAIPSELISSESGLTSEQRAMLEQHPLIGERLVRPLGLSSAVGSAIRHHHERWDGLGYPDHLSGDAIPLASRIVMVADAVDAMCSARPHKPARSMEAATHELRKCSGSQFDPVLVDAFAAVVDAGHFDLPPAVSVRRADAQGGC